MKNRSLFHFEKVSGEGSSTFSDGWLTMSPHESTESGLGSKMHNLERFEVNDP